MKSHNHPKSTKINNRIHELVVKTVWLGGKLKVDASSNIFPPRCSLFEELHEHVDPSFGFTLGVAR